MRCFMLSCRKRYLLPLWLTADFFLFTSLLQVGILMYLPMYMLYIARRYIRLMKSCSSFVIHGQLYTHSYFFVVTF